MSVVALSTNIENTGDKIPDWIQLLPSGSEFTAVDGREFVVQDHNALIAISTRENVDLNIDYEHAIQDKTKSAKPAAGWIKELAIKEGAIWGRVEWTPKATQMIANKEYRYLSPLLATIPTIDGKHMINKIINVALTNVPALEMSAFCSSQEDNFHEKIQDLSAMSQIAELMDIESCSPRDILTALQNQRTQHETQACTADVESAISQYVFPRCLVDDFLSIRQHLGSVKFQALAMKLSNSGLGMPHLLGPTQTQALRAKGIDFDNNVNTYGLSVEELAVCKETNIKPEDYIKVKESNNGHQQYK